MKIYFPLLISVFILFSLTSYSQKLSLDFDLNFLSSKKYGEFAFKLGSKKNDLYSRVGIGFGNFGNSTFTGNDIVNGYVVNNLNPPYNDADFLVIKNQIQNVRVTSYTIKSKGLSLFGAFGIAQIKKKIGFRFELNLGYYFVNDIFITYHESNSYPSLNQSQTRNRAHQNIAIATEAAFLYNFHKNILLDIGFGTPFFFPVRDNEYQPYHTEPIMVGLEPNLTIGLTFSLNHNY